MKRNSINMLKESCCHFFLKMQIFFLMFFFLISLSFQEFSSLEQSILLSLKQHWNDSEFLQSWDLKYSPCSWSGVKCIDGIGINELNLGGKNITGTIPSTIICQLNNLSLIDLSDNNISGAIPASLRDCSKLQKLDLSNNSLTGQIPGHLFQLRYLNHLSLSHNHLAGAIPDAINLFSLSDMNLSHNQLSGSIPKELGVLPGLNALDLSHNQLSGDISENIDSLLPGETLRLCSNNFKGRISVESLNLRFVETCFDKSNLCSTSNNSFPDIPSCSSGDILKLEKHLIIIIPAVGVGVVIPLVCVFYMIGKHCSKKKKHNPKEDLKFITFHKFKVTKEDILSSLKDENVIGQGGSGKVYKMVINQTSNTCAIKSIGHDKSLGEELPKDFLAEVQILGRIRHRNIVKLFCCISSTDKNLLVYEYFEKQSLDKWLQRKKRAASPGQSSIPPLDWRKRLNIAIGAAQGLCYMHHDCTRPIIHRDIKSSNILLDSEFNAKIADFGLAKILAREDDDPETASAVAGTFGYIAPEYASTFKVNVKTDIYSFGVVLLELTTGREPIIRDEQMNLAQWAQERYREGNSMAGVLDEEIMEASNLEQMTSVFKLGVMCTGASPSGRPSMKEVCNILQSYRDPSL